MRQKGKIRSWNDQRGFGFVQPLAGGKDVFLHISAFSNPDRRPEMGQVVTFDLSRDGQGRLRAARAALPGDRARRGTKRIAGPLFSLLMVGLFFLASWAAVNAGKLPAMLFYIYLGCSVVTFLAYALDKSAARRGQWRTSEQVLHGLAVLGGWPGALLARSWLRHKSKKPSFRAAFWVTVVFNILLALWFFSLELNLPREAWIRAA